MWRGERGDLKCWFLGPGGRLSPMVGQAWSDAIKVLALGTGDSARTPVSFPRLGSPCLFGSSTSIWWMEVRFQEKLAKDLLSSLPFFLSPLIFAF